jgi:putative spermidine/putrescine transport system substrate-binding protein
VQAIDISRVPAFSTVDTRLRQAPWHYADGRHYGVPYQWGPNVLLYDTEVFTTAPTSWSVLFEPQKLPDGKPNRGRVQGHGAPIYIADAALYLKSRQQALRIQDPYELDEAQYAAALALLRGQRKLVQSYWQDAVAQVQAFRNDGIVAAQSRGNQAKAALANRLKVAWTVPAEGATGWADTTMLAAHAQHSNCAYRWLEWSLSPRVQADTAAWHGSVPAVPAACAGSELLGADGCSAHGADSFDRLAFWRTPEARCAAHAGGCVPHERWTKDFAAIIQETR